MRIRDLAKAARRRLVPNNEVISRYNFTVSVKRARVSSYCSVVTIIKDEAAYLDEWITFHSMVGCSHFYIYDNGSSDGTVDVLERYERRGNVTTIPWPSFMQTGSDTQTAAYAHALSAFGASSRWMMFIDIDEFVFPTIAETLHEPLAGYEDLAGLVLPWHMFGHSGHRQRPNALVIESYTKRSTIPNPDVPREYAAVLTRAKCILDPTRVRVVRVHNPLLDGDAPTVRREPFSAEEWRPSGSDSIVLNHYYARSEEEFEAKLARGPLSATTPTGSSPTRSQDSLAKRRAVVSAIESASTEDLRIQRFVPRLKLMIKSESTKAANGVSR
jgi:Glycosyltransferase family 92